MGRIAKAISGIVLGTSLALGGCVSNSGNANESTDIFFSENKQVKQYMKEGFNWLDSWECVQKGISLERAKSYSGVYKKYSLGARDIEELSSKNIPADVAGKLLGLGYNCYQSVGVLEKGLEGEQIEEGAKFAKYVFGGEYISILVKNKIPLEYFLKQKEMMSVLFMPEVYNSELKNSQLIKKSTREVYGDRIRLVKFSELEIKTEKDVGIPQDLFKAILLNSNSPRIAYEERFRTAVLNEGRRIGINDEKIKSDSAKEAVLDAAKIVRNRIDYLDVDHDKDFIRIFGKYLPHDRYFELGMGDCDKYAALTTAIFQIFKEMNPRLNNVYLSGGTSFGGILDFHEWNSVIVLENDKINVSHIDPTRFYSKKLIETQDGYINSKNFLSSFYTSVENYKGSLP